MIVKMVNEGNYGFDYVKDPDYWKFSTPISGKHEKIMIPKGIWFNLGNIRYKITENLVLDMNSDEHIGEPWIEPIYADPEKRAGKSFFIFASALYTNGDTHIEIGISDDYGFADNYELGSLCLAGFTCYKMSPPEETKGDPRFDFVKGDVIPSSIWDQKHRPNCLVPSGMVFLEEGYIWVDIKKTVTGK